MVEFGGEDRGTPRAGARAERQRRSTKREERVRTKHPKVGGFLLAITDDPTSTKVWDQGAVGEEKVGAHLATWPVSPPHPRGSRTRAA